MKTVRFAEVVKRCGTPESYVPWTTPARDPEFKSAVEKNRVMTVHQENRSWKKDYGVVGFTKDPHAELLIFPKSLQRFAGKRTVGLRYDLLKASANKKPSRGKKTEQKTETFAVFRAPDAVAAKTDKAEESHETGEPSPKEKEPVSAREPSRPKRASAKSSKPSKQTESNLAREVRRALAELKKGKAVVAYQRLEKALQKETEPEGKRFKGKGSEF